MSVERLQEKLGNREGADGAEPARHFSVFIPFQLSLFLAGLPSDRSTACGLAPLCEGVLGCLRLLFTERGPPIPLPWLPSVCHLPFWQLSQVK